MIKMTQKQARLKIAELLGWILTETSKTAFTGRQVHLSFPEPLPDWFNDMNAAMTLFRELPYARLVTFYSYSTCTDRTYVQIDGIDRLLYGDVGQEAMTIGLMWLQWKLGDTVELED